MFVPTVNVYSPATGTSDERPSRIMEALAEARVSRTHRCLTMVRDAKNGLLTASDDRGRVLAETPTHSDGALVTLLANVTVRHDTTLYQHWGDWFAWADIAALIALIGFWLIKEK